MSDTRQPTPDPSQASGPTTHPYPRLVRIGAPTAAAKRPRKRRIADDGQDTPRIGARLAQLRRERGFTQVELARKLRVGQSVVSDYERGRKRLHGQLIVKLARILGVTSDELLGLSGTERSDLEALRPFLRRLRNVQKLSTRERKALLTTIDVFLGRAS